jgi:hypothetical protein
MGSRDYGNVFVVRAQRAAFQQWKVDVSWAKAGQVVIANGGDVAKEAGLYPDLATAPQLAPGAASGAYTAPQLQELLVGPGSPGRLYAWQIDYLNSTPTSRLLLSDDLGVSWREFGGGLPVDKQCLYNLNLDYAAVDGLYASTCHGIYRWDGTRWLQISTLPTNFVAITYGQARSLLAITSTLGQGQHPWSSVDGGRTWQDADPGNALMENMYVFETVALDPRLAYLLSDFRNLGYQIYRGRARSDQWSQLPTNHQLIHGMTLDGATGALYVIARETAPPATPWPWRVIATTQLWRSPNPNATNPADVSWELVQDLGVKVDARLLASGAGPQGLILFANLSLAPDYASSASIPYRSLDGGKTWERLNVPF